MIIDGIIYEKNPCFINVQRAFSIPETSMFFGHEKSFHIQCRVDGEMQGRL